MKGLELAERYYEEYGAPVIKRRFESYVDRIAVGLVGEGSECFGFDDEISTDHDFGPGFCVWLTDEDYEKIGMSLSVNYNQMPKEFMGYERMQTCQGGGRVGVMRISDFYGKFVGDAEDFNDILHWLRVPEHFFATATNGKVFTDPLGEFTRIREFLLSYYPEDIRIKKIAAKCAKTAQSGQYNFPRMMQRGETVAAHMALGQFLQEAMGLIYLLNKKFMPYYKWMFRGMQDFDILSECIAKLKLVSTIPIEDVSQVVFNVESICADIVKEMKNQQLVTNDYDFLDHHTFELMNRIQDQRVARLHVMQE